MSEKEKLEQETVEMQEQEVANAEDIVENACEENSDVENSADKEEVENASEENTEVENACGQEEKMEDEDDKAEEKDDKVEDDTEEVENACEDSEEVENACDDSEKMAELMFELSEAKEKIAKYESQISELQQYKDNVEMSEKMSIVEDTMSKVKDLLEETKYSKYYESGKACEYSDINGWRNEVLASISDKLIAKMSEDSSETVLDLGIPQEINKVNSIYD